MIKKIVIGNGMSLDVDVAALPTNALEYALHHGLTRILERSHASVTRDEYDSDEAWREAKLAVAQKKLAAMMAGDVRQSTERTRVDRVMKFAIQYVTDKYVKPDWQKAGKKIDAKLVRDEAIARIKKNGAYLDLAANALKRMDEDDAAMAKIVSNEVVDELVEIVDESEGDETQEAA